MTPPTPDRQQLVTVLTSACGMIGQIREAYLVTGGTAEPESSINRLIVVIPSMPHERRVMFELIRLLKQFLPTGVAVDVEARTSGQIPAAWRQSEDCFIYERQQKSWWRFW